MIWVRGLTPGCGVAHKEGDDQADASWQGKSVQGQPLDSIRVKGHLLTV